MTFLINIFGDRNKNLMGLLNLLETKLLVLLSPKERPLGSEMVSHNTQSFPFGVPYQV